MALVTYGVLYSVYVVNSRRGSRLPHYGLSVNWNLIHWRLLLSLVVYSQLILSPSLIVQYNRRYLTVLRTASSLP